MAIMVSSAVLEQAWVIWSASTNCPRNHVPLAPVSSSTISWFLLCSKLWAAMA
jgi:hypothetical protein